MADIINLRTQAEDFSKRIEAWELEQIIHAKFMKRQDLMHKVSIMDARITKIDMWLLQHKLPLDILIAIWSRAAYCEWFIVHTTHPEQRHRTLLNLRESYREFQRLPPRWQEALFSIGYGPWQAEFAEEEAEAEARKANG
jgi:hypothetical protein